MMNQQMQIYMQNFCALLMIGVMIYGAYKFYESDKKYSWSDESKTDKAK